MPEKSEFDKALGELYDLTEWEDAEAAIRELHARGPEIEKLYLDSKILPGELRALVMVSNCLEREFIHTKKAEPDFKGVMLGGRAVMFEAKSTGTGRLNKDRVLPEQVKKLDSYTALGAHCFIVATFDGLRVYRIPWTVWRSMKQRYGRNYVTEADIKEYAVRFGPGFTPDLLRGIPTMYDINPLSNVSDVLTAFCGMPYGTQPETEEWRAAVYRFSRFMNWTTPERFMLVNEIRREQPNMEKPIFSFMGVPITEDGASKLKEAMKKCGVSALEVAEVCERFAKIARATLDELPDGNKEEEHDD